MPRMERWQCGMDLGALRIDDQHNSFPHWYLVRIVKSAGKTRTRFRPHSPAL